MWFNSNSCPWDARFPQNSMKWKPTQHFPGFHGESWKEKKIRKSRLLPKSSDDSCFSAAAPKIYYQSHKISPEDESVSSKNLLFLQSQNCEWLHSFNKPLLTFGLPGVSHCLRNCLSQFMNLMGKLTITYIVCLGKWIGMKISVRWLFESFSREGTVIQMAGW